MNYVLSVLTHGDNEELLDGLIDSFNENITPAPAAAVVVQDGPCSSPLGGFDWEATQLSPQGGFCAAVEELWTESIRVAKRIDADYVFWLEHDFRFRRPVDLQGMASILDSSNQIAQVSLMRQAVNSTEREAGGVVEATKKRGYLFKSRRTLNTAWIEHSSYFTTNPSLMRVSFMVANAWPSNDSCEGRFGLDLIARGYNFAILGDGQPWIDHVGVRDGSGHGY